MSASNVSVNLTASSQIGISKKQVSNDFKRTTIVNVPVTDKDDGI